MNLEALKKSYVRQSDSTAILSIQLLAQQELFQKHQKNQNKFYGKTYAATALQMQLHIHKHQTDDYKRHIQYSNRQIFNAALGVPVQPVDRRQFYCGGDIVLQHMLKNQQLQELMLSLFAKRHSVAVGYICPLRIEKTVFLVVIHQLISRRPVVNSRRWNQRSNTKQRRWLITTETLDPGAAINLRQPGPISSNAGTIPLRYCVVYCLGSPKLGSLRVCRSSV